MDVGPWLAAIVSIIGTLATVVVSALTIRSQQNLAREERKDARDRDEAAATEAAQSAAVAARRTAVEAVISLERKKAATRGDGWWASEQADLENLMSAVLLLTHPRETEMRRALLARLREDRPHPAWWYPWIITWVGNPARPLLAGTSDVGPVFSDDTPQF